MKHLNEALSIRLLLLWSALFFDTSIRVFCADSVGECLSRALHQVLSKHGTLT